MPTISGWEKSLRAGLADKKKIADRGDDEGLYQWLRAMQFMRGGDDPRTVNEVALQKSLGIKLKHLKADGTMK